MDNQIIITDSIETRVYVDRSLVSSRILPTLNLAELERMAIEQALEETKYIQSRAALLCGISERMINHKIKYYKIKHETWRVNR